MTKRTSRVRRTASTSESPDGKDVQSTAAWERATDLLRKKSKEKLTRSALFTRAGLRESRRLWLRRQPDLRLSVIVALAEALKMKPGKLLEAIVAEGPSTEPESSPSTEGRGMRAFQ
jgi:hypothetical protein